MYTSYIEIYTYRVMPTPASCQRKTQIQLAQTQRPTHCLLCPY